MSPQPRGKLLTHGHGDEELDGEVDEEVPPQGGEAVSWRGGEAAPAWRPWWRVPKKFTSVKNLYVCVPKFF